METSDEKKDAAIGEEEEEDLIDPITLKPDLYLAATTNDTAKVINLLQQKVPGTFIESNGWTPLHWAAMHGNVLMIKALLESGASEPYHRLVKKSLRSINEDNIFKKKNIIEIQSSIEHDEFGNEQENNIGIKNETKQEDDYENFYNNNEVNEDPEKALEVSVNLLKNTPLLWATRKGHLGVIWHLLVDGYSPNDTDSIENNCLHLAAAHGDLKILKVLIDDGGNANVVNHYKNLPIDMSKNKDIHNMLSEAMVSGASLTSKDRQDLHKKNMKHYSNIYSDLKETIAEATVINDLEAIKELSMSECNRMALKLVNVLQIGKEWVLDNILVSEGEKLLLKIELLQELTNEMKNVIKYSPIITQTTYTEHVYKLEMIIEKCHLSGLAKSQLDLGIDLVNRCQSEYWLSLLLDRLKDVITADESNEHDMNKLQKAIENADNLQINKELLEKAKKFKSRLFAELGMSRAIKLIPKYNLPLPEGVVIPEGYWTEADTGKIQESENHPLPPADTGEYIWIPSKVFIALEKAINQIKRNYNGAEELGANPNIILETKEKLIKAEKDFKLLEIKNEADKAKAIELAKKLAKKLKGGKKKK